MNLLTSGCAEGNRHYISNCPQPEVVCNTSKLSMTYLPVCAEEHHFLLSDPEGKHSRVAFGTCHIHYNRHLWDGKQPHLLRFIRRFPRHPLPPRPFLLCAHSKSRQLLFTQHRHKPGCRRKLHRRQMQQRVFVQHLCPLVEDRTALFLPLQSQCRVLLHSFFEQFRNEHEFDCSRYLVPIHLRFLHDVPASFPRLRSIIVPFELFPLAHHQVLVQPSLEQPHFHVALDRHHL